jgi:hypothetical protein
MLGHQQPAVTHDTLFSNFKYTTRPDGDEMHYQVLIPVLGYNTKLVFQPECRLLPSMCPEVPAIGHFTHISLVLFCLFADDETVDTYQFTHTALPI